MNARVNALAASGADLYVVGPFNTAGGLSANNIAKWDGTGERPRTKGDGGKIPALSKSLCVFACVCLY